LHTTFPNASSHNLAGPELGKVLFSAKDGYPYLTTMLKSTLAALDLVAKRGFIDTGHVGIGGLSQGSGNSLYMLIKENRIAAASVAGGYIGPELYYNSTARGRQTVGGDWFPAPFGEGLAWWQPIDIAQHVGDICAPILFNIADQEVFTVIPLLRRLEDANRPFDAYVFPGEYHEKWQAAHRATIYRRNFDWFRFWLQDYEDPDPAKAEQYQRWRHLRELWDSDRAKSAASCGN
jgi:dipeptidyl aminopeptidase/acylaminoacyl peptidase